MDAEQVVSPLWLLFDLDLPWTLIGKLEYQEYIEVWLSTILSQILCYSFTPSMFAVLCFFIFIVCGSHHSTTRCDKLCYISNMYSLRLTISINQNEWLKGTTREPTLFLSHFISSYLVPSSLPSCYISLSHNLQLSLQTPHPSLS